MSDEVMSVKEVAEYLGFGVAKIYRMLEAKELPVAKIGGQYRFYKPVIDEWLREKSRETVREKELAEIIGSIRRDADQKGLATSSDAEIERFVHELRKHRASV